MVSSLNAHNPLVGQASQAVSQQLGFSKEGKAAPLFLAQGADGPRSHSEKLYARKKVSNKTFGNVGMSDWRISNERKSNGCSVSCKRQKIEMSLVFRPS